MTNMDSRSISAIAPSNAALFLFQWCSRRCGGLAMIATFILSYRVITSEVNSHNSGSPPQKGNTEIWTTIFAYYCLAAHLLVTGFYIRLNYATINVTKRLKTKNRQTENSHGITKESGSEKKNTKAFEVDRLTHLIIIPNYKEEFSVLRETLDVLASHTSAHLNYEICLAMEQREEIAKAKANQLVQEYATKFRSIFYTIHPSDIPGESAGKGSNIAWAAREVSSCYLGTMRKDVIVTGIDADSHLSNQYFLSLTELHLSHPDTAPTTLYAAPILFDRNPHQVPILTRVADILWGATGISGLYSGSTIAPPTSVYSLPLVLLDRVGGWDCDCEAIGEDLHMFIKCFFALNGHLNVQTILSPVSQTNVSGNGTFFDGIRARYKQGLRHMWGALDCGYYLRKSLQLWRERRNLECTFQPIHFEKPLQDSSTATRRTDPLEHVLEDGIFHDVTKDCLKAPNWKRVVFLGHRMAELHFMPVQVAMVVALNVFLWISQGNIPPHPAFIFRICSVLGAISGAQLPFYLCIYEWYHTVAAGNHDNEMLNAGLADRIHVSYRNWRNLGDYFVGPVVVLLSGVIPSFHAQISHFWTLDLTYSVSRKTTVQRADKSS